MEIYNCKVKKEFKTIIFLLKGFLLLVIGCIFFVIIILKSRENPYFVIKNLSNDTIVLEFYKDIEIVSRRISYRINFDISKMDYSTYIFSTIKYYKENLNDHGNKIVPNNEYLNKRKFFYDYIKDSVSMNQIFCDVEFSIIKFEENELEIYDYEVNLDSIKIGNYYKFDSIMYNKVLNNIIPIYLPPHSIFVKQHIEVEGSADINESFPLASKVAIYKNNKVIKMLTISNFKQIMKKETYQNEKNSFVLDID